MLLNIFVFLLGLLLIIYTLFSAIRTFVLPRSASDSLARFVFRSIRSVFNLIIRRARTYEDRDRVMGYFTPISLLTLPVVWLGLVMLGYSAIYWSLGVQGWRTAFAVSGSSLLTLGFAPVDSLVLLLLAFSEAIIGLILVALLIAYLPTMYTTFSRREQAVTLLEVRAGSPPSAVELIERFYRIERLYNLKSLWDSWEIWFAELGESHTALSPLSFFRSPQSDHSWVTAAGAVLDAAALINSTVDIPHEAEADLCIRAGFLALRRIAFFFRLPFDPDPKATDSISISKGEFDTAYDHMSTIGVPLKPDRNRAWQDFAGWRVNYDMVLLGLAGLTMAPEAPWSSDRSLRRPRRRRKLFFLVKK